MEGPIKAPWFGGTPTTQETSITPVSPFTFEIPREVAGSASTTRGSECICCWPRCRCDGSRTPRRWQSCATRRHGGSTIAPIKQQKNVEIKQAQMGFHMILWKHGASMILWWNYVVHNVEPPFWWVSHQENNKKTMEIILEWSTFMVDGHHIYLSLLESVNWGWVNYNKAFREYIHIVIDVVWCFFSRNTQNWGPSLCRGHPYPSCDVPSRFLDLDLDLQENTLAPF